MENPAATSPEAVVTSNPDIFSPGGKSRYGRMRRPKIARDFCNIDDVVMDENPAPKAKPPLQPPIIHHETLFDAEDEFTKLDDLGMRVANNFKTNLQRGLGATIKERKFFKTLPESKVEVPNVVDVTKVLKLISKPTVNAEICEVRTTSKSALKTYSNKRKHVHDSDSFIIESFGLPDEPIIPVKSPLVVERNNKIDVDMTSDVDVNLANPWTIEDFDPVPLYASEPVSTMDDFNFRGGMLHLLSYDSLLSENTQLLEATSSQDHTNFEKSRIPTPEKQTKNKGSSLRLEGELAEASTKICKEDTGGNLFEEVSDFFKTVVTSEGKKAARSDEFEEVSDLFTADFVAPETGKTRKHLTKTAKTSAEKNSTKITTKATEDKSTKNARKETEKNLTKIVTKRTEKNLTKITEKALENNLTKIAKKRSEDNLTKIATKASEDNLTKLVKKGTKDKLPRTAKKITEDVIPRDLQKVVSPKGQKLVKKVIKQMGDGKSNITETLKSDIVPFDVKKRGGCSNKSFDKIKTDVETYTSNIPSPESKRIKKEVSKTKNKKLPPLKMSTEDVPKRILRSSLDNNNTEFKKENCTVPAAASPLVNKELKIAKYEPCHDVIKRTQQVAKTICSPEIRVVLNPLSYTHRHLPREDIHLPRAGIHLPRADIHLPRADIHLPRADIRLPRENLVLNPFTIKKKLGRPRKFCGEKTTVEKRTEEVRVKEEDVEINHVKKETIDFQVGDLTWAKIGSYPYWPCMITKEPITGAYRKPIVNRPKPLYHVRFFGDKGRRAWVSAQHVMLFFAPDDLDKLAKVKAEDKTKSTFMQEAYVIKPKILSKWRGGVSEAESLKCKSVKERLHYFFDLFASDVEKKRLKKRLEKKAGESPIRSKKRTRLSDSNGLNKIKKVKTDGEEIKCEISVEESENIIKKEKEAEEVTDLKKVARRLAISPKKKLIEKIATNASSLRSSRTPPLAKKQPEAANQDLPQTSRRSLKPDESANQDLPQTSRRSLKPDESANQDLPQTSRRSSKPDESANQDAAHLSRRSMKPEEFSEESIEARKKLRNFRTEPNTPEPVQETLPDAVLPIPNSSDTDSKFSDNSSVPTSLESQAALFRRNNIFRGIPREKVCQICEEGGEVFKCKGPCNGVYHPKCAAQGIEEVIREEEAQGKNEETGKNNVEIISVASNEPLPDLSNSPNFKGMTLAEKIDFRMKEIMKKFDHQTVYSESTDSSSEECVAQESAEKRLKQESNLSVTVTNKPTKKQVPIIKHVTADNISYICVSNEEEPPKGRDVAEIIKENLKNSKCSWCATGKTAPCLICRKEESKTGSKFLQKCSLHQCGKYYHSECLKSWPQTQWSFIQSTKPKQSDEQYDTFVCPRHVCHTCISDDPRAANSRCSSDKVVKCLRCPATYHSINYCVPAGTHILSGSQIICPTHFMQQTQQKKKLHQTINTNWCFICSKGGNLICCETCPTSVHVECLPGDLDEDDTFFCEDCQSGRLPLYDEIVWVKLGSFRWWPALILFPNEVPDNVKNMVHNKGEFVVKFYGTYDHYWVTRGRTFLFQEGDKGHSKASKKRMDTAFVKAIGEAAAAHQLKKQFKLNKVAEKNSGLKPPPYIRIKVNKPVGNVRLFDGNTSNTTSCDCDPNQPHPCGPDSDCLNRLLLTECNPEVCPAGSRCNNQCFEKREYPPLIPHRTQVRGWGLKTLAPIRKGQFVIEYVGELIDEQEYQRRIQKMHEQKEENYYFLTIDKDRTLDAGPKGNVARFMNHSCQPNCETQKWTVNCDTRVGLFAKCDIPADAELTFNYNLECIGKEKKICKCGAPNCSGFIGVKVRQEGALKKPTKPRKKKPPPPEVVDNENPCFICGEVGDVGACNNKICTKYYHLRCVALTSWPEGGKWMCPWHSCNFCSKRTIRCCVKCVNSYCPHHSGGFVRHDKLLGFVCFEHDLALVPKSPVSVVVEEKAVPTLVHGSDSEKADDSDDSRDSMCLTMRLNGCVTSTPLKKSRGEVSQEESAASTGSASKAKSGYKRRSRKSNKRRSGTKVVVKSHVRNTANLFNSNQNEIKLTKFTPVRHLRAKRSNTKTELNRTDPEKDLPIRKRTRLRCQITL